MAAVILRVWRAVGQYVTPVLVGLGAILGLSVAHKRSKRRAANEAVEREHERIDRETTRQSAEIKERADETRERNRDLSGDDLRQRMRDQARRDDQ